MSEVKKTIINELIAKVENLPFEEDILAEFLEELEVSLPHLTIKSKRIYDRLMAHFRYSAQASFQTPEQNKQAEYDAFLLFKYDTATALRGILIDIDLSERIANEQQENNNLPSHVSSKKVFIVHGHDDQLKSEVARFIERANLEAVILSEQTSGGTTIIEKFENHTDVGFAIILYTPCDLGKSVTQEELSYRARQNVVFEHGYFIGKLGRGQVAVIHKHDVELPSDIMGLLYHKYDFSDNLSWQIKLAREMKSVGMDIDLNSLF